MINLVKNTISKEELENLCEWILSGSRLTKGELTEQFENQWSKWLGKKHSIFVTSGSSANLAAFYSLKLSGRLKNNKVILPTVSWSTTVAPAIQLGFDPFLCDCNLENLGLDINHLEKLIEEHDPSLIVTVNVLGFANNYDKIAKICEERGILLLEDSCESIGSVAYGKKTGCFGDISTFSFYYGHHMSTIEGGMICTDDDELAVFLRSIRCHGWDRDLPPETQKKLRSEYDIDDFHAPYTFYYPGFNMRCTEIQAFLGIEQLKKIDLIIEKRQENFNIYQKILKEIDFLSLNSTHSVISNFAYPIVHPKCKDIAKSLRAAGVEHRPLIVGSISRQPFWKNWKNINKSCIKMLPNGNLVHDKGLYIPNNHELTEEEINYICDAVKKEI